MGNPSTAFVRQYKDAIKLLAQQLTSRLRVGVMVDTDFKAEKKFYEQYASDDLTEISSRYADTPIDLPDHRRRMITPRYFVGNTLEDPVDAKQMLVDPKSTYMQAKMAAAGRQIDDLIVAAFDGTAYTGKDGTTSQAFDANNLIAVTVGGGGSATGLNKAKVLRAKRLLDAGEVEDMDRYMAMSAIQVEDLLNTTEVASSDYNTVKALAEGALNTWVNFNIIRSQRLQTDASSYREVAAWQKMGMQLAVAKEPEGRVTERPDKNYAWQVYLRMCMGATRMEEARVVSILCSES